MNGSNLICMLIVWTLYQNKYSRTFQWAENWCCAFQAKLIGIQISFFPFWTRLSVKMNNFWTFHLVLIPWRSLCLDYKHHHTNDDLRNTVSNWKIIYAKWLKPWKKLNCKRNFNLTREVSDRQNQKYTTLTWESKKETMKTIMWGNVICQA